MLVRLDHQQTPGARVDAVIAEKVDAHGLGSRRDQHDLDATGADGGGPAEWHARPGEGLEAVLIQRQYLDLGIDGRSRGDRGLATEAQRKTRADTGIEAVAHRHRVPDRRHGRAQ